MKVLVANLGSTSLKWRLFDFSNGAEALLHKGGFERVTDYAAAIEDCLGQLKQAGAIRSEADLAGVGFKTVIAKDVTGCVRLTEDVLRAMEAYNGLAPAQVCGASNVVRSGSAALGLPRREPQIHRRAQC